MPLRWIRNAFKSNSVHQPPEIRSLRELAGGAHEPCRLSGGYQLLQSPECKPLLDEIQAVLGTTEDIFDAHFSPLIARSAEFAQLIPASRICHHYQPGGLLVHGLETCLHALTRISGAQIDEVLPDRSRFPDSRSPEFKHYVRMIIGLMTMVHDIGKVRDDLEIRLFHDSGTPINTPNTYDPGAAGGEFSVTLFEYVSQVLGLNPQSVSYRWLFRPERRVNGHDKHWFRALEGILGQTGLAIPKAVRDLYLTPDSELWTTMLNIKCEADQYSVNQFIRHEPERHSVGQYDQHPETLSAIAILRWWAANGLLDGMHHYHGSMFLTSKRIADSISRLPDYDDFGRIPRSAQATDAFSKALRNRGLTDRFEQFAEPSGELSSYRGTRGVFLSSNLHGQILKWAESVGCTGVIDEAAEAREVAEAQGEGNAPVNEPPDSGDSEDISNLGIDLPSTGDGAEAVGGRTKRTPSVSTPRFLSNLDPKFPVEILAIGSYLQGLSPDELRSRSVAIFEDDLLHFRAQPIEKILNSFGVPSVFDLRDLSERHVSDRWRIVGDTAFEELICTKRYSRFLLDKTTSNMLELPQIDLRPPEREVAPSSTASSRRTRPRSGAARPDGSRNKRRPPVRHSQKDSNTGELDVLKAAKPNPDLAQSPSATLTFMQFLSDTKPSGSGGQLTVVDECVRVPMRLVDHYVGHSNRRSTLYTALKKERSFSKSTKKCLYLTSSHSVVNQWLGKLPTQT